MNNVAAKGHRAFYVKLKMLLQTVALPIVVYILMEILARTLSGKGVLSSSADVKNLLRTLILTFCFALALNANFPLGRMDLSAGAQLYMGCIIGGNIAIQLGLGGTGVLIFSMIVGSISGMVVGTAFVTLRILPMVLGLGMTLIFETISFSAFNQQGLMLYGKKGMDVLSDTGYILIFAAIMIIAVTYFFSFSTFGFRRKAIQGSQRLASDFGINIYWNCIQCYLIAGALFAASGVFKTAYQGALIPVLGMSSNGAVFTYMFPMMIGIWVGSFTNSPVLGIFIGSVSLSIFRIGLTKIGLDETWQSLVVFFLWLFFMVYRFNSPKIAYHKKRKARIAEAIIAEQELDAALAGKGA